MSTVLYHGTRRGFRPGGVLLPRTFHGGPGTTAPTSPGQTAPADAPGWVYVTADVDLAWAYAHCSPGRGRAKVCVVEPRGAFGPDPEHSAAMRAYRCEWAAVTKVFTEPTMTEEQARAGWAL